MRRTWSFHAPGRLVFGRDAAGQLGEIAGRLQARRALLVTDKQLVEAGVASRVEAPLRQAGLDVVVFDGGRPDPPVNVVGQAKAMAEDCQPDVLVGLGGGSNMDLAKATALLLAHGGKCQDYAGDQVVPGPIFPLILVPTTSGTGSEVTAAAVLNDTDAGRKFGILSNYLRPRAAVVDPLLTVSCPPQVTANSGIDALTHAVEAFTAVDNDDFPLPENERTIYQGRHPMGELLAARAIELIGRYLPRAVADGNDLEAREAMALAATTAGLAFSNIGVAVVHALEYTLSEVAHRPHGCGCGLLLPYAMRFNLPACRGQLARVAALLDPDAAALDEQAAAERAIEAVEQLKARIGIPARLSDVGIMEQQIDAMAEKAAALQRILRVNPRPVTQQDLAAILRSAL